VKGFCDVVWGVVVENFGRGVVEICIYNVVCLRGWLLGLGVVMWGGLGVCVVGLVMFRAWIWGWCA